MSVALPELPDDRRAQTGRHSRGDESSGAGGDGPASLPRSPGSVSPQVLSATAWPIDGLPPGVRPVERGAADGHAANGHAANGHAANGHAANGHGLNGRGVNGHDTNGQAVNGYGANGHSTGEQPAPGTDADPYDRYTDGRYADDRDLYERSDAHLATPPYGWRPGSFTADGPPAEGPRGRHSAGPTPGAVAARPESSDDGWTSGEPTSTTPNGWPVTVGDGLPEPSRSPRSDVRGRRYRSDVPPRRRTARPGADGLSPSPPVAPVLGRALPDAPAPGREAPPRQPLLPPTGLAQAPAHDHAPPVEDGREPADPPTVVFQAVDDGPDSGPDEPPAHHPELVDSYSEDIPEDGSPDFPGRHRRRAGEAAEERSGSSRRDRTRGGGGGRDGRGGRRRRSSFWKELPILIVVALVLTFLIQTFLAKVYVIPSGSMETTLHGCPGCNNDRVLVDKVSYRFSDPKPGDVVVFRGPDGWTSEFTADEPANVAVRALQSLGSLIGLAPPDEKDFIKRIIAVGGQTVKCCDSHNRILVDDKPLDEPYLYFLPEAGSARQDSFGPVTVPAGELWVMGDSRNNSADSRVPGHGPIPIADVIGRARLVVLPFARFGTIPSPDPQTATVGMGSGAAGAPAALGVVALLPLALLRRRTRAAAEFLPRRRT